MAGEGEMDSPEMVGEPADEESGREGRTVYQREVAHKHENTAARRQHDCEVFCDVLPNMLAEVVDLADLEEKRVKAHMSRSLLHLGCDCCNRELDRVMKESARMSTFALQAFYESAAVERLKARRLGDSGVPQFEELKYHDEYTGSVRYVGEHTSFLLPVPKWRCLLCNKAALPNPLLVGCVSSSPCAIVEPDRSGRQSAYTLWFRTSLLDEYGHERTEPGSTRTPKTFLSRVLFKLGKTATARAHFRPSYMLLDPLDKWLTKDIGHKLFDDAWRAWTVQKRKLAKWEEQPGGVLSWRSGMFDCPGCANFVDEDGAKHVNCTKSAMTDACVGWSSHPRAAPATSALRLAPEIVKRFGDVNRAAREELSGQAQRSFEPPPDPSAPRPHNTMRCLRAPRYRTVLGGGAGLPCIPCILSPTLTHLPHLPPAPS